MRFTLASVFFALTATQVRSSLAQPIDKVTPKDMQKRAAAGGGGLGTILSDHFKYVANPAGAKVPIPADQNNPAREAHRSVHAALFDAVGGGKGGKGKAPAEKPDAGKEDPGKDKKLAEKNKPAKEDGSKE
ncbi:hypothetical protein QQS21_010235 [Conoideocrella luteorostrata]|uniref:Uncharacterized protein n=1 Tax=Conoideocrella luteorostrata TaxID=1105319 RepID=A0AAJ0CFK5_9HYPO|nr:hypothetical protein QQS21_010235 [Conoideocrella luteorostrata]